MKEVMKQNNSRSFRVYRQQKTDKNIATNTIRKEILHV